MGRRLPATEQEGSSRSAAHQPRSRPCRLSRQNRPRWPHEHGPTRGSTLVSGLHLQIPPSRAETVQASPGSEPGAGHAVIKGPPNTHT